MTDIIKNDCQGEGLGFKPNWTLQPRDKIAVALTLALTRHVSGWNGATDEELFAVANDLLNVLPPVAEITDEIVNRCDAEAREARGMVPAGDGPVAAHYRGYARAVIEAFVGRAVLPPVAGDNAGLVEQLRYRSEECGEQEYHNLSGMPEDGSPGHHSAIWFRELRDDFEKAADTIAALEANVTLLGASLTSMQRDIDRLETDNARLREAISDTIQMIREWARENGFPVENSACFHRLSSALTTAPSGQEGEGQ